MHFARTARPLLPLPTMQIAMLAQEVVDCLATYPLDRLFIGHELLMWRDVLPHSTFVRVRGYTVLLPITADQCAQLGVGQLFLETHVSSFILLLHDMERCLHQVGTADPTPRAANARVFVLCQPVPQQRFFIATVYHHYAAAPPSGAFG